MSTQRQEQADTYRGPQEGEVYTLRNAESQNTLCLPTDMKDVGKGGAQELRKKVQRVRCRLLAYRNRG